MTREPGDPTHSPRPTTVVVIDDNQANLLLLQRALRLHKGLEILVESDGRRGFELVNARQPGLVLVDLNLPTMDGETILRALQADPATAAIPAVVISGDATPETKQRLREAGAHDYLEKPLKIPTLLELVTRILGHEGDEPDR